MHNRNVIFGAILWALAFLPEAQAVRPAPDGCYPNFTTAEGCNALNAVSIGIGNTGVGSYSLFSNTTGNFNTAIGTVALALNNADNNTAVGTRALLLNTVGHENTAVGANALLNNDTGTFNNAFGSSALLNNTTGGFNNVHGRNVLVDNVDGSENNAFGDLALENNTSGSANTAVGDDALRSNVDGSGNVAIGDEAGTGLGISVNNCIAIGAPGDGPFVTHDNTCFIGSIFAQPVSDPSTQVSVFVDQFNNVGVFNSSRRFKHDIQAMDNASETLYELNPVTFKFNGDCKGTTQYGLIAEEVANVDPQLVVHGKNGEVQTVHYEQINSMLLNEFLKEHKKVEELQNTVAQQKEGMEALTVQLKEQAAQIQKVSAQLEMNQSTSEVVNEP
jgi:hypothetical protein